MLSPSSSREKQKRNRRSPHPPATTKSNNGNSNNNSPAAAASALASAVIGGEVVAGKAIESSTATSTASTRIVVGNNATTTTTTTTTNNNNNKGDENDDNEDKSRPQTEGKKVGGDVDAAACGHSDNSVTIPNAAPSIQSRTASAATEGSMAVSPPPRPATSLSTTRTLDQQQQQQKRRFLLFIKILFKTLDQCNDVSVEQRETARAIVADCTRRNRLGDPAYVPLMAAVDARLRRHLGEQHWRKAHLYLQHYMNREAARTRLPFHVANAAEV